MSTFCANSRFRDLHGFVHRSVVARGGVVRDDFGNASVSGGLRAGRRVLDPESQDPKPLTAVRTGVPMELERIVGKLLAKDREVRYQGAADVIADLKAIEPGRATSSVSMSASSATSGYPAWTAEPQPKSPKRSHLVMLAGGVRHSDGVCRRTVTSSSSLRPTRHLNSWKSPFSRIKAACEINTLLMQTSTHPAVDTEISGSLPTEPHSWSGQEMRVSSGSIVAHARTPGSSSRVRRGPDSGTERDAGSISIGWNRRIDRYFESILMTRIGWKPSYWRRRRTVDRVFLRTERPWFSSVLRGPPIPTFGC